MEDHGNEHGGRVGVHVVRLALGGVVQDVFLVLVQDCLIRPHSPTGHFRIVNMKCAKV